MTHDVICSERLELRLARAEDAEWAAREIARPEVHQWLTSPPHPYRVSDAQEFLAGVKNDPKYRIITLAGEPVGAISINVAEDGAQDLGYWLMPSAWGQGFMPEAARALLDWNVEQRVGPISSGWILGNDRSERVLTKLGFRKTGIEPEMSHFHGQRMDLQKVVLDHWGPMFKVKTERLVLDGLTDRDLGVIHAEWGVPEIARMVASVIPNWTLDQARVWLTSRRPQSKTGFGLGIRLHDGTLIGSVGLGGDPQNVGYMFSQKYWGKGYATEAVGAFLNGAFEKFADLDHVTAEVFDDNAASVSVLTKLGFERVGPTGCESLGRVEKSASSLYRLERSNLKVSDG